MSIKTFLLRFMVIVCVPLFSIVIAQGLGKKYQLVSVLLMGMIGGYTLRIIDEEKEV